MVPTIDVYPTLDTVREVLAQSGNSPSAPNLVPLTACLPGDLLTPTAAYLKIAKGSKFSFLLESAETSDTLGRYSFIGANPRQVLKTGSGHGPECDPLPALDQELSKFRVASVPGLQLPSMIGGAVGYVGYDCIRYFEPKTALDATDVLQLPESLFMFYDTIIAFDHVFQQIKVISHLHTDDGAVSDAMYEDTARSIKRTIEILQHPEIPLPHQPPIQRGHEYTSNTGQEGYQSYVRRLKDHIYRGDIFQCVPSQRLARPTNLHPFNIYRHLRTVNPSPYLFYVDCDSFSLVGASPEVLAKTQEGRVLTHPIAGTVKRGKTPDEDKALALELKNSLKDRAEHVMLVDLARNDINRICDPATTEVDFLMSVQKFSHVQHLVSQVSGVLRPEKSRFDAFRSIFPAGTTTGAPKIRAMQLIAELEREKRGVYAGAVGYFGYHRTSLDGASLIEGEMNTCIALRTMVVKDGVAYLQAGGGIVFDSDPYEEYVETLNKLGANVQCIKSAEGRYD